MVDDRERILNEEMGILPFKLSETTKSCIRSAMDEYGKHIGIEFLKYTLEKMHGHSVNAAGNIEVKFKGEWITLEQLFENFL